MCAVGHRHRVVNGKRTDLSDLVIKGCRKMLRPSAIRATPQRKGIPETYFAPKLFQGHTRFATSSVSDLPGAHPHQWSPPATRTHWAIDAAGNYVAEKRNIECFITHNGDLDFFELHGIVYPLADVQALLTAFLDCPMPSSVGRASRWHSHGLLP